MLQLPQQPDALAWYSNIAPFSWLTQRDADNGREALNFSEWNREQKVEHLSEVVLEGEMPPFQYRLINGDARLSETEKEAWPPGSTEPSSVPRPSKEATAAGMEEVARDRGEANVGQCSAGRTLPDCGRGLSMANPRWAMSALIRLSFPPTPA